MAGNGSQRRLGRFLAVSFQSGRFRAQKRSTRVELAMSI